MGTFAGSSPVMEGAETGEKLPGLGSARVEAADTGALLYNGRVGKGILKHSARCAFTF